MKLSSYFIVPKTKRPLDDENERSTGRMVGNKQEKCSGNSVTCTDHVKRVDDRCLNYYIIIFYFILSASFFFSSPISSSSLHTACIGPAFFRCPAKCHTSLLPLRRTITSFRVLVCSVPALRFCSNHYYASRIS